MIGRRLDPGIPIGQGNVRCSNRQWSGPDSFDNRRCSRFPPIVGRVTTRTVLSVRGRLRRKSGALALIRKGKLSRRLPNGCRLSAPGFDPIERNNKYSKYTSLNRAKSFFICGLLDTDETLLGTSPILVTILCHLPLRCDFVKMRKCLSPRLYEDR